MPEQPSPSSVGSLSEFAVASALAGAGHPVFVPLLAAHVRIDLMYEAEDGEIRRVQCKTGHLADGFISFWTCSNTGGVRKTYENEVDEFGVYCVENDTVYLVPVERVPSRGARLRVAATRSNQKSGIRWADDFVLGKPW